MLTFVLLFLSTCLPFLAGLTFAAPIEEQSQGLVKLALRKVPVVRRDEVRIAPVVPSLQD